MEELQTVLNEGQLTITNFDSVKKEIEEYVKPFKAISVITSEEEKKTLKAKKTEIGKRRDEIKSGRLGITKKFLGAFDSQCKELEKELDEAFKTIGVSIENYESKDKVKVKKYNITIKGITDEKLVVKITDLLNKNHIEYKVEEK